MLGFVIDTNFFVNLQRPINLGANKEEVVENFIKLTKPLISSQKIKLFTSPGSLKELRSFFEGQDELIEKMLNFVVVRSPDTTNISLNASLFAKLVEEINKRLYRGLRVNEELLTRSLAEENQNPEKNQIFIKELRSRYRKATREGFLDSTTDLEIILLAKELRGGIVSSDNGLLEWARTFGCEECQPEQFVALLKSL